MLCSIKYSVLSVFTLVYAVQKFWIQTVFKPFVEFIIKWNIFSLTNLVIDYSIIFKFFLALMKFLVFLQVN